MDNGEYGDIKETSIKKLCYFKKYVIIFISAMIRRSNFIIYCRELSVGER